MKCKGVCFFASVPNAEAPHYIVIASDADLNGEMLLIPISSIKFSDHSRFSYKGEPCKYYDDACTFDVGDIKADNGRDVIVKPSFARYEWAQAIGQSSLLAKQVKGDFSYKCAVSDEILKRIQDGAKKSKELAPVYKKFFDWF